MGFIKYVGHKEQCDNEVNASFRNVGQAAKMMNNDGGVDDTAEIGYST